MTKRNKHIGSSLDAFLEEEGISRPKEPKPHMKTGHESPRQGTDAANIGAIPPIIRPSCKTRNT
jgi:hypothetical protein